MDLGPGQYLPVYENTNKPNKIPFLSSSNKIKLKKIEQIPGPGAYYSESQFDKYPKITNQKQPDNKNIELIYNTLERDRLINEMDPIQIFVDDHFEKLGFLSKNKRFLNPSKNVPGPGAYLREKSKSAFLRKENVTNKKLYSIPLNPLKVETIPAKNHAFGYDFDKTGDLVRNDDPLIKKKYLGDKFNSVGPANYEVTKNNDWTKKGSIEWKKTLSHTHSNFYKKKKNSKSESKNFANNLEKNFNKTFNNFHSKKKNDFEYNIKKNNNNMSHSFELIRKDIIEKNNPVLNTYSDMSVKFFKEKNKKRKEILFQNHANKLIDRSYLLKNKNVDTNPGPGYYLEEKIYSAFNTKKLPEDRQYFGSNRQRFENIPGSEYIGPGAYFREDYKLEKLKYKEQKEKIMIPQMNKIKKYKPIKLERNILPGPGDYEPEIPCRKRLQTAGPAVNFGSKEPRFKMFEANIIKNNPGPGSYIEQEKWVKLDLNKNFSKILQKPNSANFTRRIKSDVERQKDNVPPVGTYNPDAMFTVEYKIAKNCTKLTLVDAPFNSTRSKPRFDKLKDQSAPFIGPGIYHKEENKKIKQVYPAFKNSSPRFRESKSQHKLNPGQYDTSSYFDWNKKTFNVLYL